MNLKKLFSWRAPTRSRNSQFSPSDIATYYDEWTPKYFEVYGDTFQASRMQDLGATLRYLLERSGLRDGQTVLDAGCGICGPSVYFAKALDLKIEAITVSDVQVREAQQKIDQENLAHKIHVFRADYHDMAELFPEDHFDVVLFLESFSHATRPGDLLNSVYKVLKPGGTVYIKDYFKNMALPEEELQKMEKVTAKVNTTFRTNLPEIDRVSSDLERIGFERDYVGHVQFELDNTVWDEFDARHEFDLYDSGANYCDWVFTGELIYKKPS